MQLVDFFKNAIKMKNEKGNTAIRYDVFHYEIAKEIKKKTQMIQQYLCTLYGNNNGNFDEIYVNYM